MRCLIFGAGDVGTHLARVLAHANHEIVLIDRDADLLRQAEESLDIMTVHGDATHWKVLEKAEAGSAQLVVSVTGSDDANVVAAALASQRGASRSVARVDDPAFFSGEGGLETGVLGIHAILCASRLVSEELLRLVESLEATSVDQLAGNVLQLASVTVSHTGQLLGASVQEKLKALERVHMVGIGRDGQVRGPHEIERLELGDILLLCGRPAPVAHALGRLTGDRLDRKAVIVGGGGVGHQLARMLRGREHRVQILERDRARCEWLSDNLRGIEVIHGDATNLNFLRDEHVDSADYVVAATRADEVNLLVSLMAKDLGVPTTFSLVHRPGYSDIYGHLGIHGTAGRHDVVSKLVAWLFPWKGCRFVGKSPVDGYAILECVLPSGLAKDLTVRDLAFGSDVAIAGIVRQHAQVEWSAATRLEAGDIIAVLAPAQAARELSRRLTQLGGHS
jgi:trk system potassium uptake protein TrkA